MQKITEQRSVFQVLIIKAKKGGILLPLRLIG